MRAITIGIPSKVIRMEIDGHAYPVMAIESDAPYIEVDDGKIFLTEAETFHVKEMEYVFRNAFLEVADV